MSNGEKKPVASGQMRTRDDHETAHLAICRYIADASVAPWAEKSSLLHLRVTRTKTLTPADRQARGESHEHEVAGGSFASGQSILHASRCWCRSAHHSRWWRNGLPDEILEMGLVFGHTKAPTSLLRNLLADLELGCECDDACADIETNKVFEASVDIARTFWIGGRQRGEQD